MEREVGALRARVDPVLAEAGDQLPLAEIPRVDPAGAQLVGIARLVEDEVAEPVGDGSAGDELDAAEEVLVVPEDEVGVGATEITRGGTPGR